MIKQIKEDLSGNFQFSQEEAEYFEIVHIPDIYKLAVFQDGSYFPAKVKKLNPCEIYFEYHDEILTGNQNVDITLQIYNKKFVYKNLEVTVLDSNSAKVAFTPIINDFEGWSFKTEYMPYVVFENDYKFNDRILFRIKKISAEEVEFHTSLRNKLILPGMEVTGTATFPMAGEDKISFEITGAGLTDDGNFWKVRARLTNPGKKLKDLIGRYVFQFSNPESLDEIRSKGLSVSTTSDAITFGFVSTEKEYRQVLELRKTTYSEVGKVKENTNIYSLSDAFDKKAQILIGKYKGIVVSTLRLNYHNKEGKLEQELYVKLPDSFPSRDKIVEITRVCVHRDFRKSDILYNLFKFAAQLIVISGRKWVVGSSIRKQLSMYEKIGFKNTNISYIHKEFNNEEDFIFLGNSYKSILGSSINPLIWYLVYSDVCWFSQKHNLINLTPLTKIKLKLFKSFTQVFKLLINFYLNQKDKRK